MAAIGRDPGESTMIRVTWEVREMIEEEKIIPREPLNDCIKRGILENRRLRSVHPSIETKDSMNKELHGVTTNPNVVIRGPVDQEHIMVYLQNHPGEELLTGDIIHHINGNHNDNRPENLLKVHAIEHAAAHIELNHDHPRDEPTKGTIIVGKDI